MTDEFEFDDATIDFLVKATAINNLLCKAIPMFDKLSKEELELLDRLTPCKGALFTDTSQKESTK